MMDIENYLKNIRKEYEKLKEDYMNIKNIKKTQKYLEN